MSLRDQMASDLSIFFNTDEFGETISYNGQSFVAIVDRLAQPSFDGNNTATYADVMMKSTDVPNIAYQDIVQFDSYTWIVEHIQKSDRYTVLLKVRRKEGRIYKG